MKWNDNWYVADSSWYDDAPTGGPGGLLEGDAGARLNEQNTRNIYTMDLSGNPPRLSVEQPFFSGRCRSGRR